MKRTVVESINNANGSLEVRFAKETLNDEGEVIASGWHRATFDQDTDIAEHMTHINAHLASMGDGEVSAEEINKITSFER